MKLMTFKNWREARLARWVARGISLLVAVSLLLLVLFNEDFRNSPTLPTLLLWLLSLSLLIAWRWEKLGGMLTLLLTPVILISLFVQWSGLGGLMTPLWQLFMIALAFLLPFLIAAWLYLSVARYAEMEATAGEEGDAAVAEERSNRTTIIVAILGLAAVVLFFVPLFTPVQQQVEMSPENRAPFGYAQLIDQLRNQGAVVGVSSVPVDHPLFSVTGRELNIDGEIVQAFEYANIVSSTADAGAIERQESPAWNEIDWPDGPHFYQENNILLLYVGSNDDLITILEAAFGSPFAKG
jgi:hypothetical protein